MATTHDESDWPPSSLAAYYGSNRFLTQMKRLQRRLAMAYQHIDAESIVFDAASDILVKEIHQHCIYDKYLVKFPTENHFIQYVYEASCRKVIDSARSFQRRFRQLQDENNVQYTGPGPEDIAIESEERACNENLVRELERSAIRKLPKLDKLILKHRVEGRTFQEIAELLDIGVATVHRRYKAIIKNLAEQLGGMKGAKKYEPTR